MRLRFLTAACCLLAACSSSMEAPDTITTGPPTTSGDSDSGASSGMEAGSDESGDTESSGGDGAEMPDMGSGQAPCDPWIQDCPEGFKCAHAWEDDDPTTKCVELNDEAKQLNERCNVVGSMWTGQDDCDVGLSCQFVNQEGAGTCIALCEGSPEQPTCAEGSICQLCNADCPSLCLRTCDPLDTETCGEEELCTPNNNGNFVCTFAGKPEEQGAYGSPCEYVNDCGEGFACVESGLFSSCKTGSCCTPYCDLEQDDSCPDLLECVPWMDADLPPDLGHVGVCAD